MISQRSRGDTCNVRYYRVPSMESSFVACASSTSFHITCSARTEFVSRNPKAWNRLIGWIIYKWEREFRNYAATVTITLCSFWTRTIHFIFACDASYWTWTTISILYLYVTDQRLISSIPLLRIDWWILNFYCGEKIPSRCFNFLFILNFYLLHTTLQDTLFHVYTCVFAFKKGFFFLNINYLILIIAYNMLIYKIIFNTNIFHLLIL